MGHLTPFLRLACLLLSHNCMVTLITAKSFVSVAESDHVSSFLIAYPEVKHLQYETLPSHPSNPTSDDPFLFQFQAISRSVHLLHPLLSSSPPPSAIFCDLIGAKSISQIASDLGIPYYVLVVTSAKFLCFSVHLPNLASKIDKFSRNSTQIEIPGLSPLSTSSIPLSFLNPNHPLGSCIISNVGALQDAKGILINTFDYFEAETLAALNNGRVLSNLAPVLPIGPLKPGEHEKDQIQCQPWLENQPAESVVYVSFGSRTAMSIDQIRELRGGLEKCGHRFLWVIKTTKIDKDDKEELKVVLGDSFLERTKNRGMVVKGWVNQQEILSHPSVAGFISHCGWNSVMEAAERGIPVLAWPQHGDQAVNAEVLKKAGLGILLGTWGLGSERLVKEEEIAEKIVELMEDSLLKNRASKLREEAGKATQAGGSSKEVIIGVLEKLR